MNDVVGERILKVS